VRRPRRVSGPGTRSARPVRPAQPARRANPVVAVVTHPLLDRLLHGRAWIGIVAFALIGIVTMQLGLLKLNAGIGRALEHETALQREDSALSVENSEVAAGNTVELQAAHMGMQLIPAGTLRFLSARGSSEVGKALQALNARAAAQKAATTEATTSSTSTESNASSEAASGESTASTEATSSTTAGASPEASSEAGGATAGGQG
jgi:hypothetical protein